MLPSSAIRACNSQRCGERQAVPERSLADHVENLERRVDLLEHLPARVSALELQIQQLRSEIGEQCSDIRQQVAEIKAEGEAIRNELRREIREGDEETRRYMPVPESRPRRRKN
jgi:hypothetical protein